MRIIFTLLIFVAICNANDNYLITYGTKSNKGLMQYNIHTKFKKIYELEYSAEEFPYIFENVLVANERIFVDTGNGSTEIVKNKFSQLHKNISLLGYLEMYNLILARIYKNNDHKLYLIDLNFNIVQYIDNNISQFSTQVLSNGELIYKKEFFGKTIEEYHMEYWLYDINTNRKTRLKKLENTCQEIKSYRTKTNELICKAIDKKQKNYILTNIDGIYQSKINFKSTSSILYYDKEKDILFYRDIYFSLLQFAEVFNLKLYDFNTKQSKIMEENIIVKGMDKK